MIMLKAISILESVKEHHLTHQSSFDTIPLCNTSSIIVLGKDCSGTAALRKFRALRLWVRLWRFENLNSDGLLIRVFNDA